MNHEGIETDLHESVVQPIITIASHNTKAKANTNANAMPQTMVRGCDDRSIRPVDDDDDDDDEQQATTHNNTGDLAIIRPVPVRLTPGMSTGFAFVNNNNNNNGTTAVPDARRRNYIPSQDDTYPAGILIDDDDDDDDVESEDHVSTISPSPLMVHTSMMHQHDLLFSMDDAGPSVCCMPTDNETENDTIDRPPEYYDQSIRRDIYNNNTQEEMERMAHCIWTRPCRSSTR
eukprot:scaffold97102_cov46-Attheya_sp.AAC.1